MKITTLTTITLFFIICGSHAQQTGSLNDPRDGTSYKTISIGNLVWMAENLNYSTKSGSWCYDNNASNCNKFGRLYNWETSRNVCPSGWYLPSHEEWTELIEHVGNNAGTKLKAKSGWKLDGNGTDNYGFAALPGGYQQGFPTVPNYTNLGYWGKWWTSTEIDAQHAWYQGIQFSGSNVISDYIYGKELGLSVRCVRKK